MFITLEGIEGSGKSTLMRALTAHLEGQGRTVLTTLEPGAGKFGEAIRRILLDPANTNLAPMSELFLYLADRAQHVAECIKPALDRGEVVLCDRFVDSTLAYQGYGRGLDLEILHNLNAVAVDGVMPDLTLLLDLPVEVGLGRALSRNASDGSAAAEGRFEAESLAFHARVRAGYLALAEAFPERITIIDGSQSPEKVADQALGNLEGV
jgi:dTMP kinase